MLAPADSTFVRGAGTWGLTGIVPLPRDGDFAFIVTLEKPKGDPYNYEDGLSPTGLFEWDSQNKQGLEDDQIEQFINHDYTQNSIDLFLRKKKGPYFYIGRLRYVSHDPTREHPVHFCWQVLDWDHAAAKAAQVPFATEPSLVLEGGLPPRNLVMGSPPRRLRTSSGQNGNGRTAVKKDFAAIDAANRELGLAGETWVVDFERRQLMEAGRPDLAARVCHVAQERADGLGYDVCSFELNGTPKLIEVKTTRRDKLTPFYITENERRFANRNADCFVLYRLYGFSETAESVNCYTLKPPLDSAVEFVPAVYRAYPR